MAKSVNIRANVVATLENWEKRKLPIDHLMAEELARIDDQRDRGFYRALVAGVVRWRGYLDHVLAKYSSHSLAKMKPLTRQALRVGVFQLLFMDRVPPSAAINETIRILKQRRQPGWLTGKTMCRVWLP